MVRLCALCKYFNCKSQYCNLKSIKTNGCVDDCDDGEYLDAINDANCYSDDDGWDDWDD